MPLQECQRKHTSTEFLERIAYLDHEEWHETSKLDYYLAAIAAQIHQFMEAFAKAPKAVSVQDHVLKFEAAGQPPAAKPEPSPVRSFGEGESLAGERGGIEVGPEAVKDPKWAEVNQRAKMVWGQRLGVEIGGPNGGIGPTART